MRPCYRMGRCGRSRLVITSSSAVATGPGPSCGSGGEAAAQCQALVVRTVTLDQTAMRLELRLGGKEPARCPGLALPFAPVSVAEDARFELARRCHQHAFQACALGH